MEEVRLPSPPPCALFQHVEEEVVAHPRMGFCLASFCAFQVYLQGSHENEEPGELVHLKLVSSSLATMIVSRERFFPTAPTLIGGNEHAFCSHDSLNIASLASNTRTGASFS